MADNKRKKPDFIIVFKDISEENEVIAGSLTEGKGLKSVSSKPSVMIAKSRKANTADMTLYKRLGVVATDLQLDEVAGLSKNKAVLAVVPNEIRHIPAPITELPSDKQPDSADTQLEAFLEGMQQAASLALAFARGKDRNMPFMEPPKSFRGKAPSVGDAHAWPLELIGIHAGYTRFTGKNVPVAVLDTGIDLTHPDFSEKLREGDNAVSFVEGESVQDENGHGTHCAGTIGAVAKSRSGMRYSVAPDTDLLIAKVLSNDGFGTDSDILEAINWANERGARVISLSLGTSRQQNGRYNIQYEQIAKNLMDQEEGALLVCAAGNDSNRPHYTRPVGNPAACPSIAAVGAVDQHQKIAYFSDCEMDDIGEVNFSGPGVNILSSWTGGSFRTISGTSMATPHVAGVAALYIEQSPGITPRQLWGLMARRAAFLGNKVDYGSGLVQAPDC